MCAQTGNVARVNGLDGSRREKLKVRRSLWGAMAVMCVNSVFCQGKNALPPRTLKELLVSDPKNELVCVGVCWGCFASVRDRD